MPPAPTTPSTLTALTSEGGGWSGLRTHGESKLFSEQLVRGEIGRCCIEIRPRPLIHPTYLLRWWLITAFWYPGTREETQGWQSTWWSDQGGRRNRDYADRSLINLELSKVFIVEKVFNGAIYIWCKATTTLHCNGINVIWNTDLFLLLCTISHKSFMNICTDMTAEKKSAMSGF